MELLAVFLVKSHGQRILLYRIWGALLGEGLSRVIALRFLIDDHVFEQQVPGFIDAIDVGLKNFTAERETLLAKEFADWHLPGTRKLRSSLVHAAHAPIKTWFDTRLLVCAASRTGRLGDLTRDTRTLVDEARALCEQVERSQGGKSVAEKKLTAMAREFSVFTALGGITVDILSKVDPLVDAISTLCSLSKGMVSEGLDAAGQLLVIFGLVGRLKLQMGEPDYSPLVDKAMTSEEIDEFRCTQERLLLSLRKFEEKERQLMIKYREVMGDYLELRTLGIVSQEAVIAFENVVRGIQVSSRESATQLRAEVRSTILSCRSASMIARDARERQEIEADIERLMGSVALIKKDREEREKRERDALLGKSHLLYGH